MAVGGVSPTSWPPLPLGKTRYPYYRRLGGPQGRSGQAENLVPTEIRSQTVQPVVIRYTNWATWPTCTKLNCIKLASEHFSFDSPTYFWTTRSHTNYKAWTCHLHSLSYNLGFFFIQCPHMSFTDFVVFPPGHGRSVTDSWVWDTHEERLCCPDDVSGDIGRCSARRTLKPKFY